MSPRDEAMVLGVEDARFPAERGIASVPTAFRATRRGGDLNIVSCTPTSNFGVRYFPTATI
jgi:hypothetical protein